MARFFDLLTWVTNRDCEVNMRRAAPKTAGPLDPSIILPWKLPLPIFDIVTAKNWARLSYARKIAAFDDYPFLWTPRTIRLLQPKLLLSVIVVAFTGMIVIARLFTNSTGQLTAVGIAAMLTDISLMALLPPLLESGAFLFLRRPIPEDVFLNRLQQNNATVNTQIAILVRQALSRTCRCSEHIIRPDESYLSCWRSSGAMLHEFCAYFSQGLADGPGPMKLAETLRTCERRSIEDLITAIAAALATPGEDRSPFFTAASTNNQGNGFHGERPRTEASRQGSPRPVQERHRCGQVLCYESFFYQRRYLAQRRILPSQAKIKLMLRLTLRIAIVSILVTLLVPLAIMKYFPFVTSPWQMTADVFFAFLLVAIMLCIVIPLAEYGLDMLNLHPVILEERQILFPAPAQRLLLSNIQCVELGDQQCGRRQVTFYSSHASRTITMPEKADVVRLQAVLPPNSVITSQSRGWHPQHDIVKDHAGIIQWPEPFFRGFCLGSAARFLGQVFTMGTLAFALLIADAMALGAIAHRNPAILLAFTSIAAALFFAISFVALCLAAFQRFWHPERFQLAPDWINVGTCGFSLSDAEQITLNIHPIRGPMLRIDFPNDHLDMAMPNSPEIVQELQAILQSGPAGDRIVVR